MLKDYCYFLEYAFNIKSSTLNNVMRHTLMVNTKIGLRNNSTVLIVVCNNFTENV